MRTPADEPREMHARTAPGQPLPGNPLYLELIKKCLLDSVYGQTELAPVRGSTPFRKRLLRLIQKGGFRLVRERPVGQSRADGSDWPARAHTMIGMKRLSNLQACIEDVLGRGVPGDLIETGVWRGGATIFMRAVLKAHGVADRVVWVADSFRGLPKPDDQKYPDDRGDDHWVYEELAVPLEAVKENFRRYDLLDEQVRFLVGWFRDTLPGAPIDRLAVARLDGDMYESTIDALNTLYPKISPGGYLIVDDYGAVQACRKAVHDYRDRHRITDPIETIDWTGIFWRKSG